MDDRQQVIPQAQLSFTSVNSLQTLGLSHYHDYCLKPRNFHTVSEVL